MGWGWVCSYIIIHQFYQWNKTRRKIKQKPDQSTAKKRKAKSKNWIQTKQIIAQHSKKTNKRKLKQKAKRNKKEKYKMKKQNKTEQFKSS